VELKARDDDFHSDAGLGTSENTLVNLSNVSIHNENLCQPRFARKADKQKIYLKLPSPAIFDSNLLLAYPSLNRTSDSSVGVHNGRSLYFQLPPLLSSISKLWSYFQLQEG